MGLFKHLVRPMNVVEGTWDDIKDVAFDLMKEVDDTVIRSMFNLEPLCPEQYGLPSGKPKPKKFVNYHEYIKSDTWKRTCKAKLKSVGYKCEMCGSAMNLNVHHITYKNLGHEELDDLLVVCKNCHKKLHAEDLKRKEKTDCTTSE